MGRGVGFADGVGVGAGVGDDAGGEGTTMGISVAEGVGRWLGSLVGTPSTTAAGDVASGVWVETGDEDGVAITAAARIPTVTMATLPVDDRRPQKPARPRLGGRVHGTCRVGDGGGGGGGGLLVLTGSIVSGRRRRGASRSAPSYVETHGSGRPLVLLHDGLGSGEMFGPVIERLAEGRQVIAPDLQGHGRTADIDRPITLEAMANDFVALIAHLGHARSTSWPTRSAASATDGQHPAPLDSMQLVRH